MQLNGTHTLLVQIFSCVCGVEQGDIYKIKRRKKKREFFCFLLFSSVVLFCLLFFVLGGEGWGGVNFLNISETMADRICAI